MTGFGTVDLAIFYMRDAETPMPHWPSGYIKLTCENATNEPELYAYTLSYYDHDHNLHQQTTEEYTDTADGRLFLEFEGGPISTFSYGIYAAWLDVRIVMDDYANLSAFKCLDGDVLSRWDHGRLAFTEESFHMTLRGIHPLVATAAKLRDRLRSASETIEEEPDTASWADLLIQADDASAKVFGDDNLSLHDLYRRARRLPRITRTRFIHWMCMLEEAYNGIEEFSNDFEPLYRLAVNYIDLVDRLEAELKRMYGENGC